MSSETNTDAEDGMNGIRPTLPASDYYATEIFDLDRARIFHRHWFCVGREEQVANPGDFIVRDVVDESILIVRDDARKLGAYYNVCRHRGTRLCDGDGYAGKAFACPYHAWTYSLDGR